MTSTDTLEQGSGNITREEMMGALFANMVIQQSNMALMLLGKMPHPQSGETVRDLEAARLFIDQLEMLQAKTRGNLSKAEEDLLKQSLTTLRMAFVESVNAEAPTTSADKASTIDKSEIPSSTADEEPQKKFS